MGAIVAGYREGNQDLNANVHGSLEIDPPPRFDDGGGAIANVGISRYGMDGNAFPDIPDESTGPGPANRYHAGSFCFTVP